MCPLLCRTLQWLGRGLRVSALDNDLFVQAIENTHGQWLMGLQWHPEYLLYHGAHRRIFADFVRTVERLKLARLNREDEWGTYPAAPPEDVVAVQCSGAMGEPSHCGSAVGELA